MESTAVSPASVPTHARGTTTRNRSSIGLPGRVRQYHTQSHLTTGRAARPRPLRRPRRRRRRLHQPPHLPQRLLPHFDASEAAPQALSTSTPPPSTPLPTRPLRNPSRPSRQCRKMRPTRRPPPSLRLVWRPMLTPSPPTRATHPRSGLLASTLRPASNSYTHHTAVTRPPPIPSSIHLVGRWTRAMMANPSVAPYASLPKRFGFPPSG